MRKKIILFSGLCLAAGIVLGVSLCVKLNLFTPVSAQVPAKPAADLQPEQVRQSSVGTGLEDSVINVASSTGKAVVSISTEHTEKIKGSRRFYFSRPFGDSPYGEDDTLRKFFEDFFGSVPEREYKQMGLGSGVIINNDGYILTNQHVIDEADKITVTLSDGREFNGELKGSDPRSDLAVIKINAKNLPVASLGDSDDLKIGQWVVAIGNPYSFAMQNPEPTVTAGVVSALHRSLGRSISRDRDYNDLIQTDAAINPGNSGGPLVNLKGEVVGINVAIFSTTGGYQGIGFAVPVNSAKRIISRLIEGKKIAYGWLGLSVQNLTEDLAQHFGTPDKNGVLVAKVLEDGPGKKAGIKEGDIIRQIDVIPINNVRELLNVVGKIDVGKRVKVSLIRDRRQVSVDVVIGERPLDLEEVTETRQAVVEKKWRGLEVQNLTPESARRFMVDEKKGVLVTEVEPGSAADEAGLRRGYVIEEINKQPITNVADYEKVTGSLKGSALVRTSRGFFLVKEKSEGK